ncbi:hypothetical protein M422DRAFT_248670 [Sphaerobolus stellatus SS14]|nr:hypothetical protein M422DRAFT_248670 [Sphaerobolus stellatus SS14]
MSRPQLSLLYKHFRTLTSHKTSINCVKLTVTGELLASGDDDGYLCIWIVSSGELFDTIHVSGSGPIIDIIWVVNARDHLGLIFSAADECIYVYVKAEKDGKFCAIAILEAHSSAVEMLAYDPYFRRLASVGGGTLKLWDVSQEWKFIERHTESSNPYIAKAVHFFSDDRHVLVGYLETHKVCAWAIEPWQFLWE